MNKYIATETAYKNGFAKAEICTRVGVAYEQLGKVHTELCRSEVKREQDNLIYDIQDILNAILKVEVKLGMLKSEEDL